MATAIASICAMGRGTTGTCRRIEEALEARRCALEITCACTIPEGMTPREGLSKGRSMHGARGGAVRGSIRRGKAVAVIRPAHGKALERALEIVRHGDRYTSTG